MTKSVHGLEVVVLSILLGGAPVVAESTFRLSLEEPVAGEIHGGVGNLRGLSLIHI